MVWKLQLGSFGEMVGGFPPKFRDEFHTISDGFFLGGGEYGTEIPRNKNSQSSKHLKIGGLGDDPASKNGAWRPISIHIPYHHHQGTSQSMISFRTSQGLDIVKIPGGRTVGSSNLCRISYCFRMLQMWMLKNCHGNLTANMEQTSWRCEPLYCTTVPSFQWIQTEV